MTNRIREILDFAQNEPDAIADLLEMVRDCTKVELELIARIAENLAGAAASIDEERRARQISGIDR